MLGLRRHTVAIEEHDDSWLNIGENICDAIRRVIGSMGADVQHVGSTSVPGLPAKPIIDIVIGLDNMQQIDVLKDMLCSVGYMYRGVGAGSIGHVLVRESAPEVRTEHIHVVPNRSKKWDCYILFRDALRKDPVLCGQYAELKRTLAAKYPNDRTSYGSGKNDFISAAIAGRR